MFYATESYFLADQELNLLDEMTSNIRNDIDLSEQDEQRKRTAAALLESEERFAQVFHQSPIAIVLTDLANDTISNVNAALLEMTGFKREELIGQNVKKLNIIIDQAIFHAMRLELQQTGRLQIREVAFRHSSGEIRFALNSGVRTSIDGRPHHLILLQDINKIKQAAAAARASEEKFRLFIEHAPAAMAMFDCNMRYIAVSQRWMRDYQLGDRTIIGHSHYDIFPEVPDRWKEIHCRGLKGEVIRADEDHFVRLDGVVQWIKWEVRPWFTSDGLTGGIVLLTEDITERKQAQAQLSYMASLIENVSDAIISCDQQFVIRSWNKAAEEIYGWKASEVIGKGVGEILPTQYQVANENEVIEQFRRDNTWKGDVIQKRRDGTPLDILTAVSLIRDNTGHPIGSVAVNRNITDRVQAERRAQNQLQRLRALRTIDMAITSTLDLRHTLDILLEQVSLQLNVDAAAILLLNKPMHTLEYAAGYGFRTEEIRNTHVHVGEGHAGRAVLERRIVLIPNTTLPGQEMVRASLQKSESVVFYCAIPLITKGQVNGVLEVYQHAARNTDPEWLDFLEALAGQAAIAIDNAQLFDELQRSNTQLMLAYDATIEGWSRALDLRDSETEGHSQRVTGLTVRLAQAAGMSSEQLIHVQRGALLHDIGKLGVPDHILLKPGELTQEEQRIMRQHPQYAYEMLTSIEYLRPALDIPYCHHESWDGTGYPRGLKGKQIPLAARLFAVVDVFDALRSDRPYRLGWSEACVLEYLRHQAGTQFDPEAVDLFLNVLGRINPVQTRLQTQFIETVAS